MAKLLIILYIFIHRLKYHKNYFFTDSQNDLWAALNTLNSHQMLAFAVKQSMNDYPI